ncbi:MAG: geranylgeranylglyceryl/heptaprenylglyceryl phosphate synthase, partial [Lewinella sp.]|nr:geranylgeranylglyceryl/heptaprenylglyceryl phosphate synthase [Lewinella sp.]
MIYSSLSRARQDGRKQLAVLVDPDKTNRAALIRLTELANQGGVDYFFWGGSLINETQAEYYLSLLRSHTSLPIVLFPGNIYQLSPQADALLFLSLISGRNPDLLIGQQVLAAPRIKRLKLEVISTGYLYIDGGRPTSVGYMSNTQPIPADKPEIARATALAGAYLGHRVIYLDAGSGAHQPVPAAMIQAVRDEVDLP